MNTCTNKLPSFSLNYGPIASIWLDGYGVPVNGPTKEFRIEETYSLIQKLQPESLISAKWGYLGTEDYFAPEYHWLERNPDKTKEMIESGKLVEICNHIAGWGYAKKNDGKHRGAESVIEKAIDEMNKYNPSNLPSVDRPLRKLYKYILLKTIADAFNDAGLNKLTAFDFDGAKVYADNSSSFPFDLKVNDKSDAITIDFDAMEREIKGVSAICSIELSQLQDFKKKLEQNIPSEWIIEKKSSRPKITDEQFGAMATKDIITKEEITTIRDFFGWSNRGSGWRGTIVRAPNGLIGMIVGDANWGQSRTITVELSNGNRVKFDMNNLGANLKKTQELEYLLEPENQFVKMGY